MRRFFTRLHRWFGLFTALFLTVAGLTGAVISWDHELDAALNPRLFRAASGPARHLPGQESGRHLPGQEPGRPLPGQDLAQALPALELAQRLEAADPRLRVTYLPLAVLPGRTLLTRVEPRVDPASGRPFALDFNQVAQDPATGAVQGRREWGRASLSREQLLPFLYKLHYSLHLPRVGGLETGVLFMGLVAMVWLVDGFVALGLAFPRWSAWRQSLAIHWRKGGTRLTFDLHRSGGVWVWGLLVILAGTSVSMNLGEPVVRPLVARLSRLSPSPFAQPLKHPVEPALDRPAILERAALEAARRGWTAPAGGLFYAPDFGLYGVGFFAPGQDHGDGGLGNPWLYFDGRSGALTGATVPGQGSAGDVFLQAQFPLHSGRLFGLAGRIGVSMLGLAVAMLSVTGVLLWARRRLRRTGQAMGAAAP